MTSSGVLRNGSSAAQSVRRAMALGFGLGAVVATTTGCSRLDDLWARAQSNDDGDASATTAAGMGERPGHRNASHRRVVARHRADGAVLPGNDTDEMPDTVLAQGGDAGAAASADAGATAVAQAGDAGAAAPRGPTITAIWTWVPIFERMDSNGPRLGYMRAGASVEIDPTPAGTEGCARGWYALRAGGYVCLSRMTSLNPDELGRRTPTQPDLSQPMPYTYMTTYRAAVMYRWLPSLADMRETEPERFGLAPAAAPGAPVPAADAGVTTVSTPVVNAAVTTAVLSTADPLNARQLAAPASTATAAVMADAGAAVRPVNLTAVTNRAQAEDAGVRIEDLAGQSGTPLLRRMLSGMYVSVDREATSAGRRFWRTQNGGYVERSAVSALRNAPTFQGVTLDAEHTLPMAFMVAFEGWTYDLSPDNRTATRRERAPRLTVYSLTTDPPVTIGRNQYYRTREGFYVTARNTRIVQTVAPPADMGPTEKWIEVNLDRQMLIAYEGARPVYVTLVSTGRRNEREAERNYETVQGAFRIESKHVATTMDGNSAGDGPYSIEDVPWVMYFQNSFALHGAFWHNNFGYMRSHGCVNMAPADARWIFHWSEPALPAGWHGVYANASHPGTRVYVHYERQALGTRGGPDVIPQH